MGRMLALGVRGLMRLRVLGGFSGDRTKRLLATATLTYAVSEQLTVGTRMRGFCIFLVNETGFKVGGASRGCCLKLLESAHPSGPLLRARFLGPTFERAFLEMKRRRR